MFNQKIVAMNVLPDNIVALFDDLINAGLNVCEKEIVEFDTEKREVPEWLPWLTKFMEGSDGCELIDIDEDLRGRLLLPSVTSYLTIRLIQ